jgi:hypothetical protein
VVVEVSEQISPVKPYVGTKYAFSCNRSEYTEYRDKIQHVVSSYKDAHITHAGARTVFVFLTRSQALVAHDKIDNILFGDWDESAPPVNEMSAATHAWYDDYMYDDEPEHEPTSILPDKTEIERIMGQDFESADPVTVDQVLNEMSWVPIPFRSDLEWAVAKALVNDPSLQRNIPDVTVFHDEIKPTQLRLDPEKVNQLVANGIVDGGLAFRNGSYGQIYLWDGHHRHAAANCQGTIERTLKVFDLLDDKCLDQGKEGMSLQDWACRLGCRVSTILKAMDSDDRRRYEYADHEEG